MYEESVNLSAMIGGNSKFILISYSSLEELLNKISNIFEKEIKQAILNTISNKRIDKIISKKTTNILRNDKTWQLDTISYKDEQKYYQITFYTQNKSKSLIKNIQRESSINVIY